MLTIEKVSSLIDCFLDEVTELNGDGEKAIVVGFRIDEVSAPALSICITGNTWVVSSSTGAITSDLRQTADAYRRADEFTQALACLGVTAAC